MRRPPPLSQIVHFPITGGIAALAAGVTIASITKNISVEPLYPGELLEPAKLWQLVTCILPHGGAIHLIFNLMWLWTLGSLVEVELGQVRTFLLYIFLAFGSSAAQYALGGPGIGLSGVVYGLWGLCLVLSKRGDRRFHDATDPSTNSTMVFWFFLCIFLTYAGTMAVGNVAHGAGAVFGMLAGLAMTVRPKLAWWATAVALLAVSTLGATISHPGLEPVRRVLDARPGSAWTAPADNPDSSQ